MIYLGADHLRSRSTPVGKVCKACKSFVSSCSREKNLSSSTAKAKDKDQHSKNDEVNMTNDVQDLRSNGDGSPRVAFMRRSYDIPFTSSPKSSPPISRSTSPSNPLSRKPSRKSRTTTVAAAAESLLRSINRRKSVDTATLSPPTLSRAASRKGSSPPIMFSNSNGLIKPLPMEKTVECTLEELCFGCIKKIKITRDAVTNNGQIIQEEEVLTIKIKPGWTKGTKITFEGMGNEIPGADPADVVFEIAEREHPMYARDGDDLELAVEVPLVKALTGCSLSIPLLGGENMNLTIDEIIYPGYQEIIAGHGMPKPKEQGERGNLIITFLVEFPEELTEDQRSEVVSILEQEDEQTPYLDFLEDSCNSSS